MSRKTQPAVRQSRATGEAVPRGQSVRDTSRSIESATNNMGGSGMLAWLMALVTARWLLPTEGSGEGLTLWLVQLVLFTAIAKGVLAWRFGSRPAKFDAMDGAICLLVLAQAVSTLAVVFGVGDQRAAINVAWEWFGSAVLVWLIRQELRTARVVREICVGLSLTAAVLAGYGIWQTYVGYPQMVREYKQQRDEIESLTLKARGAQPDRMTDRDMRRLQELQNESARQGIPTDESSLQLWQHRLMDSREPIGLFALANSLAGLLAVMLLVTAGLVSRRLAIRSVWLWVILILIGYCLMLTKSRTALVGTCAGITWWGLRALFIRRSIWKRETFAELSGDLLPVSASPTSGEASAAGRTKNQRLAIRVIASSLVIVLLVLVATLSGGLDKFVISEAPKSFEYRLQWWNGTWATIREHFWIGTGPGNFRDYYTQHKLPESSEEIADPHNLVFDVWANAGLFGLIGLLACVGLMVRTWLQPISFSESKSKVLDKSVASNESLEISARSPAVWGAGLGFVVTAVGLELTGQGGDSRLWWLGGLWLLVWFAIKLFLSLSGRNVEVNLSNSQTVSSQLPLALEGANVALLVHLLGAGGIAMPAITLLLWLIWGLRNAISLARADAALNGSTASNGPGVSLAKADRVWLSCSAASAVLCGLCLFSATLPELQCRVLMTIAETTGNPSKYFEAAAADRFSLLPIERLADLSAQQASQSHRLEDVEIADQRMRSLIERRPSASWPWRRLGQLWWTHFETTHNPNDARRAADAFREAVNRYPHHALLLSELATAYEGAGEKDQAREWALRALRQDDINRAAGHSDKYLPKLVRLRMESLPKRC